MVNELDYIRYDKLVCHLVYQRRAIESKGFIYRKIDLEIVYHEHVIL